MKRMITIIVVLLLIMSSQFHIYASGQNLPVDAPEHTGISNNDEKSDAAVSSSTYESKILSQMSEDECIAFIKQYGIDIPSDYDEATWAPFVQTVIRKVEENPNYVFGYNYTVTLAFANAIKDAVNDYYDVESQETVNSYENGLRVASTSELVYSEEVGPWKIDYNDYNCYIFSIGTPTQIFADPGCYSGRSFSMLYTLWGMAEIVEADLIALQHFRVRYSTELDISNLCTNEQIICLRKGQFDYHFMRFSANNWFHKPGSSAILRYLSTPNDDVFWINEGLFSDGYFPGDTYYTGEIMYISYDGHDWDYMNNYNGTHVRTCSICDNVTVVENCDLKYVYSSSNYHKMVCSDCGYTVTGLACDFEYTYTGDGNSTHTHSGTCQDCGHVSTGTCSFAYSYCGAPDGTHQHISTCTVCGETKGTAAACTYLAGSSNCRICGHNKNAIVTALGLSEDTFNYVNE